VLDVVMPVMGGPVTARHIRELGSQVPILFVTGYDPDSYGMTADSLMNENNVLVKPYRMQEFIDKLYELLGSSA